MRKAKKWMALALALCMAVPNVTGLASADAGVVQAAETAKTWDEWTDTLKTDAVMSVQLTGEDQKFDGTKVLDVSEDYADSIKNVSTGSIIMRFKVNSLASHGVILGARTSTAALPTDVSAKTGNETSMVITKNDQYYMVLSYDRAGLNGPTSFADGNWHTVVLSSSSETTKTFRMTIDGKEMWSLNKASLLGMYTRHAGLDTVTIGGYTDGTRVVGGFNGLISDVIVTTEEISDADAIALSAAGSGSGSGEVDAEMGTAIAPTMLDISLRDNTFLFTGGEAVQGGFDQTRGIRNYIGQFEEYIRWRKLDGSPVNARQRYTFSTGTAGQTLADIVDNFDAKVGTFKTKAAVYMVGVEDYSQGTAKVADFKASLESFINKSLALKNNQAFVIIQKPFAVNDAAANANIEAYCAAVDEVVAKYAEDDSKYARMLVVDHYAMTKDNADFKANKLTNNKLNAQGHLLISKQFAENVLNYTISGYPHSTVVLNRVELDQPDEYLDVQPTAAADTDSLAVTIPAVDGVTSWKYELDMDGTIVSGTAATNTFEITGLVSGKSYVLKIQSADGEKQLVTTKGVIAEGSESQKNVQVLDAKQQKIVDMVNNTEEPMTWLFMGDSITHASGLTFGYDGIAQAFEEFVKEELGRTEDVVLNTAVANADTITTIPELDQRLTNYDPDVISIMLGTNDCSSRVPASTLEVFERNMRTILDTAVNNYPDAALLIRSMTPVFNDPNRSPYMPSYMAVVERLAQEYDAIYVDQYTSLDEATATYQWLPGKMFTDNLHPEANGHRVMTNMFIKACGLWTEDSPMTNLFYSMDIAKEQNNTVPALVTGADQIGLSVPALEAKTGLSFGDVVLRATSASSNQTYEVSVKDGENFAVLNNLPKETAYTVEVSAHLTNAAKEVTFAAAQVTLSEDAPAAFDIYLSSRSAKDLTAGAVVGELSVDGLVADGEYTYTLGEGADNAAFVIEGNQLKVKTALTEGTVYQISVKAANGASVKEQSFEIKAVGKQLLFEKENVTVSAPVDLTSADNKDSLLTLEEGTIIVKYTSTSNYGVQSLFSVANGTTGNNNRHFHVYITPAGRLGCEIRNESSMNYHIYKDAAVTAGTENAIAFKADAENNEYKLFANGKLIHTISAATLGGYKFVDDITGTDTAQIGATKRGGSPAYGFGGTVSSIQVYGTALDDVEIIKAVTLGDDSGDSGEVIENLQKAGSISVSAENMTEGQPFASGTADSRQFRIPALITLDNGDLLAAADARWTGGADWGGLDTIASVSSDHGETWYYSFPIWFPDSNEQYPGNKVATTSIDPVLVQGNDGTIYCIADMNPSGITTGDIMPAPETGYVEINGVQRLVLTGTYVQPTSRNWATYGNPEDYEYYVGDFNEDGFAPVLNKADHTPTKWGVDEWYNIYTVNAKTGAYEATLTQTMVNDTDVIQQNAFYKDSVLHVYNTGYLWLVTSTDNGRTWENPTILNPQIKREGEVALLASPGQGIVASNGDIIIPFYDHGDNQENASIIWSSDNGKTWTRSNDVSGIWTSENEVVEIYDGVLRMFVRNGTNTLCYADFTKNGDTWVAGAAVQTGIPVCSTCNVSAIRHSETIDGKMAVLVACPGGSGRANGKIFTFLVEEDNSMELYNTYSVNNGYYAYSCMTELDNGNLGLLWEDQATAIRYDEIPFDEAVGHEKNITLDMGAEYIEEKAADKAAEIKVQPNEKVATVTSELVTEEAKTLLHDHSGNINSSLDSFLDTPNVENSLEKAEVVLTNVSGNIYKVYNPSTEKYVYRASTGANGAIMNLGDNADTAAYQVKFEPTTAAGGTVTYKICRASDSQRYVIFFNTNMDFNTNSAYNATWQGPGTSGDYELVLLEKQETVSDDDVIPGYTRAAEIVSGNTYLITYIWESTDAMDGSVFVLDPTQGSTGAQTKLVGETMSVSKNVITVSAVAPGETTAVVGDVTYNITVTDPADSPTYAGNDLPVDGMKLTAGSTEKTEGPLDALFDGDESTFYHSNWSDKSNIPTAEDFWVTIELPEVTEISGMRYLPRQSSANGRILSYEISYSLDGENWTVAASGNWANDLEWKLARFEENVEAKFVKIFAVDSVGDTNGRHLTGAELRVISVPTPEEPDVPVVPEKEVCEIFTDVTHGAWYEAAVQYVYDKELILGNGDLFSPDNATTRAMVSMILYRLEGSPEVTDYAKYNQFKDVEAGAWYADAVAWALNEGLATGDDYNMLYNPDAGVTREQLATFLYRYAEYAGKDTEIEGSYDTLFGGTYVSEWAKAGFAWAIENEIIKGAEITDGAGNVSYDLNPQGGATRAQFATVLQRYLEDTVK